MTIRDDLEAVLATLGIPTIRRGETVRPYAHVGFGGSASDQALIQAAWSVTFVADTDEDMQALVAPFWLRMRASEQYIPQVVVGSDVIPGVNAGDTQVVTVFGDTAYDWATTL